MKPKIKIFDIDQMFSLNKFSKFSSTNCETVLERDLKRIALILMFNSSGLCDRNHLLSLNCSVLRVLFLVIHVKVHLYYYGLGLQLPFLILPMRISLTC